VFDFTVKYFGCLKHVPLLPHLFDTLLKIWALISNSAIVEYCDEIENEVMSWKRTSIRVHKFGGIQFNIDEREIGHIHGNGLLDIPFTKKIKQDLLLAGRVKDHHVFKNSGWISFRVKTLEDRELAIELLRRSYRLINDQILKRG
jgi:hypothetical protein